uniref:Ubiquitin-like domain-containing protein n=1 Tax=Panagrolaimus superbus TaxID=310955 RepID=A0A914YZ72_9BILA
MSKPPIKKTKISETVVSNIMDEYDDDEEEEEEEDGNDDDDVEPFRVAFTKHLYEEDEPEPIELPTWLIELKVQIMDGKSFKIKVNQFSNVSELKKAILKMHSIPPNHQHLFYNCKLLNDGHTLIYYEVDNGVTLKMYVAKTVERCEFYSIRADLLDPEAEQLELPTETLLSLCHFGQTRPPSNSHAELTIQIMNGQSFTIFTSTINMVGKLKEEIAEQEKIPIEHQNLFFNVTRRFAIKVRGKYEDMKWLGQPSTSTREIPGEWPMAYHGTSEVNILEIVNSGFDLRKCVRMAYGKGIYCSPDPKTALWYSKDYSCEINKSGTYRVILQCRANPEKIKVVRAADNRLGEYWTVPDGADLRPYGVCVYFYPVGKMW